MKISKETRINAIMYVIEKDGAPVILQSQDMNITLSEYLGKCMVMSLSKKSPIPFDILEMDFQVEHTCINNDGHKFTVLGYEDKESKKVCVINKLDFAGTF